MAKETLFKLVVKTYQTTHSHNCNDIDLIKDMHPKDKEIYLKYPIFTFERHGEKTEQEFVENYGNPLAEVLQVNNQLIVEEEGDKLSIKKFTSTYYRKAGRKYFEKKKHMSFFTINKKTFEFYVGGIENYQNKIKVKKRVRRNPVTSPNYLKNELSVYFNYLLAKAPEMIGEFVQVISDKLKINFADYDTMAKQVIINFYNKRGIKLPNNIESFLGEQHEFIPKTKEFKKHKNKFIDTFMSFFQLKGNEIKKALHLTTNVNVYGLKSLIDIFGYDLLYNEKLIQPILDMHHSKNYFNVIPHRATKKEMKDLLNYFKWLIIDGQINAPTLSDHIRYFNQLRSLGEEVSFDAKTIDDFVVEHANWSTRVAKYQNGDHVRNYPQSFKETIDQPIFSMDGVTYHPVLLTTSEEYNMESTIQSNCVRNYIQTASAIIVSVRLGDENSKERATVEYRVMYDSTNRKFMAKRVQYLGRYNKNLPETWNPVLEILDQRVNEEIEQKDFKVSIKTTFSNQKVLTRELVFGDSHRNENGNYQAAVFWDKEINQIHPNNFDYLNF